MIDPTLLLDDTLLENPERQIYGIHSATQGFVRAFLAHAKPDVLRFRADNDQVRAALRAEADRARPAPRLEEIRSLDDVAQCAMFYTMPKADLFWLRQRRGAGRYAVCGIHHSLTGRDICERVRDLVLAPTEPWDALICTSRAARGAVSHMVEGWSEFLRSRGGALPDLRLQLPVIPLGVDTEEFCADRGDRPPGLRAELGIPPDALVVLFLGRLNFSSKAHPLPMFLSLERARRDLGRPVHLVQAGWYASDAAAEAVAALARETAPSVVHHHIGSVAGADRARAYAAADVFMSLADNVQETFGLTLVEAMASGLPVVATDWDGYRDTVDAGVTGFLVPTTMAPAGSGWELGLALGLGGRPYNRYLMDVAQATVVDVGAAARAVVTLGADAALRRRMGEAGSRRAAALFDWRVVIAAYRELWAELDGRRTAGPAPDDGAIVDPLHPDPFAVFSGFASHAFAGAALRPAPDWDARLRVGLGSQTLKAPSDALLDGTGMEGLVRALHGGGKTTCAGLCERFGDGAGRTTRSLLWLIKVGAVEIA